MAGCGNGTVTGDTMALYCRGHNPSQASNRTAKLSLSTRGPGLDVIQWNYTGQWGHAKWYRGGNTGNYTCKTNKTMF